MEKNKLWMKKGGYSGISRLGVSRRFFGYKIWTDHTFLGQSSVQLLFWYPEILRHFFGSRSWGKYSKQNDLHISNELKFTSNTHS